MKLRVGYDELWRVIPYGIGLNEYADLDLPPEKAVRYKRIMADFNEMCADLEDAYSRARTKRRHA